MKLTIVIPVYNEEKTILEVIQRVKDLKLGIEKEIIVVDDGSKDNSYKLAKTMNGIILLKHKKNLGKGAGFKTALKQSTGEIIIIQDADMELDPIEISKVIKPILDGKSEVVYGSRNLHNPGKDRSPLFYFGGYFLTKIVNFLYGTKLTDEPCGYKAFKTKTIKQIKIKANRFEWEPEVTAKLSKKNIKIIEVPVSSVSRSIKEGKKLRRRDGVIALLTLMRYRFKD